eukprot:6299571-Prymnesium_polylepis.1
MCVRRTARKERVGVTRGCRRDLQSDSEREQVVKRIDGAKSGQGCECEGVTVGALRAVAPAARTVANLVPA